METAAVRHVHRKEQEEFKRLIEDFLAKAC
jgi:hypothetical protein